MKDRFTSGEAAHLVGLKFANLHFWCRHRVATPSHYDAVGTGNHRVWSFNDVLKLRVMAILRARGANLSTLRQLWNVLQTWPSQSRTRFLVIRGSDRFLLVEGRAIAAFLRADRSEAIHTIIDLLAVESELLGKTTDPDSLGSFISETVPVLQVSRLTPLMP